MTNDMFQPVAVKSIAKLHNSLQINTLGKIPESILGSVKVEDIPVKSYHKIFSPIYVLDARIQNAVGAGPPKWEPRSRIFVYLGHLLFHAGSVSLVWNLTLFADFNLS